MVDIDRLVDKAKKKEITIDGKSEGRSINNVGKKMPVNSGVEKLGLDAAEKIFDLLVKGHTRKEITKKINNQFNSNITVQQVDYFLRKYDKAVQEFEQKRQKLPAQILNKKIKYDKQIDNMIETLQEQLTNVQQGHETNSQKANDIAKICKATMDAIRTGMKLNRLQQEKNVSATQVNVNVGEIIKKKERLREEVLNADFEVDYKNDED